MMSELAGVPSSQLVRDRIVKLLSVIFIQSARVTFNRPEHFMNFSVMRHPLTFDESNRADEGAIVGTAGNGL